MIKITHRVKFSAIDKHIDKNFEYENNMPIPNVGDHITGYFRIPLNGSLKIVYAICRVLAVDYEYHDDSSDVSILINSTCNQWR